MYVKLICEKEVQLDFVKNTTRHHTHHSAVIKFHNFRDKELFMASHAKQLPVSYLARRQMGRIVATTRRIPICANTP